MTNPPNKIRTRMAPSPTGNLHVGTAHTTIFNFLFAKHHNGTFIIRFEDTDPVRSKKEFEENILEGLAWLGIHSDEPIVRQTERGGAYRPYLDKMLGDGSAFYCHHSEKELEAEQEQQKAAKTQPKHVCSDRNSNLENGVIRIKNDAQEHLTFIDSIRGPITFDPQLLGDFALARSIDSPLYHFAVVVDDHEMAITHVIRGEDHIPNTPKHILIQKALGFFIPQYAHLSLLLGSDRSKLSKRHGATSVSDYRALGYLPDAMFNYMALLGWNPGTEQEIFSREELIKEFSLERVQKAGAIFDITKLDWINGEYIRAKTPQQLLSDMRPYLMPEAISYDDEYIKNVIALEQPRLKKLSEITEKTDYFFREPSLDPTLLSWKSMNNEEIKQSLLTTLKILEAISSTNFNRENLETVLLAKASEFKDRGSLLWPLRVALCGKKTSPGPFDILAILNKEISIQRIQAALAML